MKRICGIVLLVMLSQTAFAASPFRANLSYGFTLDDNITRAELDRDIEKDTILTLEGVAAYNLPVNAFSYLGLRGTLSLNKYLDFSKLDNNRLGISASYHIKPVIGFTAPKYYVRLRYEDRMYDSEWRDGDVLRLGLGLSMRLSELVSLRLGYINEEIDADNRVYDADNSKYYLDVDYLLTDKNTLYVTLSYFDGEIVSTAVPTSRIIAASTAIVRDDAFLELTPARFAYKLDAKTTALKIGDVHAFNRYHGLDTSFLYYDTSATGGNDYTGLILSIYYSYQF